MKQVKFSIANGSQVKSIFLGFILGIIPCTLFAQNSTNSPHTRYGYGYLADKAFISQRGMGGIGYGLRNPQMINPMNPASFSNIDSLTFMFDMGVTAQVAWLKDAYTKERKINGYLEYLALQFPLMKKLGIGVGLEPVSHVGYNYGDTSGLSSGDDLVQYIYRGSGGLSRVYAALSYDLLNRISLGVKASYLFGDIIYDRIAAFNTSVYTSNWTDTLRTNGILYDFGLQYHQSVGKNKFITFGAVYSPKTRIKTSARKVFTRNDPSSGFVIESVNSLSQDSVFEMPETYGFGFTYNQLSKITVGADVLYQRWKDAKYYDQQDVLNNRLKINAGFEIIPNYATKSLLNRIRYRGGLSYSNSYLQIKNSSYNEYGVNIGFGIPMIDRRSFLNLAFEYSLIRPKTNTLINEQYFRVSLGYTFNELWFFKRKVQ